LPARVTGNRERAEARGAQIVVENGDRRRPDDVLRRRHREPGNRQPACQRFQQHQTERIGAAWKHEDVGARIDGGEFRAMFGAEENRVAVAGFQPRTRRTVADHDLGSRQVQRQKCVHVLFDGQPADHEKDRAF